MKVWHEAVGNRIEIEIKPHFFAIHSMNVTEKVVHKIDMKTEHAEKSVILPALLR